MFELMHSISIDAAKGLAHGEAVVPAGHPLFADHFPSSPLLPGSLLIELAAQISGPLAEEVSRLRLGLDRWAILGMVRHARFLRPISLPATLRFTAEVCRARPSSITSKVTVHVGNQQMMRAELLMAMVEAAPDWEEAICARDNRLAQWKGVL